MSESKDQHDLSDLTVKDLRQLAVEHDIPNRSRLAREDLIQALSQVIATRVDAEPAPAAAPSPAVAAAPEPEVIDPMSVGSFAPPAAADVSDDDEDDDEDEDGAGESGEPEVLDPAAVQGEGGRRRRRRRRRRKRGGGNGGAEGGAESAEGAADRADGRDGDSAADADGEDNESGVKDGEAAPAAARGPIIDASAPAPRPERSERRPERQDRPERPERSHDRSGDRPNDGRRPERAPQPAGGPAAANNPNGAPNAPAQPPHDRQPRPRLEGPQRPVPSVLERLRGFTAGILDLCDPSTPSWAQPRMSELLAEAGLAPIPATGLPHPDFHDVVGSVPSAAGIENGHIAVIEVPGFALRGDRGDLFPLRKAKVRVAGAVRPQPVREPQPARDAPRPQRDERFAPRVAEAVAEAAPENTSEAAPETAADAVVVAAVEAAVEAAVAAEPTITDVISAKEPVRVEASARPARVAPDAPEREERETVADEGFQQPAPETATAVGRTEPEAQTDARPQRSPAREPRRDERRPAPRGGRNPGHATPADMAPSLPLKMQDADELAALPKAEGFRPLGLNDQILADLAAMGFAAPTAIQEEAIPAVISGVDLVGQAQTGTGKTAAFVLPLLQRLYTLEGEGPVALVLSPTRELARQIYEAFIKMAGASGARAALIYGGVSMDDQFDALDRKPHVVIGTPGRIIDHMKRRSLDLSRLSVAVLDEADQMLDIGFWPDVTWIISHTPHNRQTLLFSATFPDPIRILAEKHMRDPQHIRIKPAQITVDSVDQKYIAVDHDKKTGLLAHFIETQNPEQLVVFCRTKHQTDRVAEVLKKKGMSAGAIHGDLPQTKRERMLKEFRERSLQCLIATNVAARGLDIPSVSHVVNYDIPEQPEEYVHRIGRTARNGAKGVARTFITPEDGQFLIEIEKHIGMELEEEPVEGYTTHRAKAEPTRTIAAMQVGTPRLLKPLVGGIRLGRRR